MNGERKARESVLWAHDDDDDNAIFTEQKIKHKQSNICNEYNDTNNVSI